MSLHDLAVELHKTIQELTTGVPGMSLHELTIEWPCYWAAKGELSEIMAKYEGSTSPEQFDSEFGKFNPPPPETVFGGGR